MDENANNAMAAARAWLAKWSLCPHDSGLELVCPTCTESLAATIETVCAARTTPAAPEPEHDPLYAECSRLIDRLHHALEVLADDSDDAAVAERLRAFRVALLKFAWREAGDPEAEEILAREGHDV